MLSDLNNVYKEKLKIIKEHFGEANQYKKLIEEIKELEREFIIEFSEHVNVLDITTVILQADNFLTEFVDCYVVASQIDESEFVESFVALMFFRLCVIGSSTVKIIFEYDEIQKRILQIAKYKIDRTLERIKSGYYEPAVCPDCFGDGFHAEFDGKFEDCTKCKGTGKIEQKEE